MASPTTTSGLSRATQDHRATRGHAIERDNVGVDGCQEAFERLKLAMTKKLVLMLFNHLKPYKVGTDASNYSIDGVHMQDGHPMAFESRMLNSIERQNMIQEKEMTVMVHYLCT